MAARKEFKSIISTLKERKRQENEWTHWQRAKIVWIKWFSSQLWWNLWSESGIILFTRKQKFFLVCLTAMLKPCIRKHSRFNASELLHPHPGGRLGVMVDEKRSSVRSTADLPTSWQGAWFQRGLRVGGGLRTVLRSRSLEWRGTLWWHRRGLLHKFNALKVLNNSFTFFIKSMTSTGQDFFTWSGGRDHEVLRVWWLM